MASVQNILLYIAIITAVIVFRAERLGIDKLIYHLKVFQKPIPVTLMIVYLAFSSLYETTLDGGLNLRVIKGDILQTKVSLTSSVCIAFVYYQVSSIQDCIGAIWDLYLYLSVARVPRCLLK